MRFWLITLISGLCSVHLVRSADLEPQVGFDLFWRGSLGRPTRKLERLTWGSSVPPPNVLYGQFIITYAVPLPYNNGTLTSEDNSTSIYDSNTQGVLMNWLGKENTVTTYINSTAPGVYPTDTTYSCVGSDCSFDELCIPILECLLNWLIETGDSGPSCLHLEQSWQCTLSLEPLSETGISSYLCTSHNFNLDEENWAEQSTDDALQTLIQGGVTKGGYTRGLFWTGLKEGETFSEAVGRQLLNLRGLSCILERPCQPVLDCTKIGSWTAVAMGEQGVALKEPWAFLVISALNNINQ